MLYMKTLAHRNGAAGKPEIRKKLGYLNVASPSSPEQKPRS